MIALSLGVLAGPPRADAVEWLAGGSVSQRLQFESNGDLDENGEPLYGATTALGLDLTALTPQTQWQFETGASLGFYGGSDSDELNNIYPNFAAAVSHNGKYIDTGASLGFALQPAAFSQRDDTGITDRDATELSVRLAADASMALDPRNALSLGVSGSIIRFPGGSTTLEPNTNVGMNLSWVHSLSADAQTSIGFGASRYTAQSEEDPESLSFSLSGGFGHTVNPRLSFDASLGVSATHTTETRFDEEDTDFSLGAIGDLGLSWRPAADTQFAFALSHGLEPSSRGELETTTAIGAGLNHAVNSWISAGIDLLAQRQRSTTEFDEDDTPRTSASLSPNLAFSLTPDVALQLGYSLRLERESGSTHFSNGVFLTLTRAFNILP